MSKAVWFSIIGGIFLLIVAIATSAFGLVPPIIWIILFFILLILGGILVLVKAAKSKQGQGSDRGTNMTWYEVSEQVNNILKKHPHREELEFADQYKTSHIKNYETDPGDLSKWPLYAFVAPGVQSKTEKLAIYSERDDDVIYYESNPTKDMMLRPFAYYSLFSTNKSLPGASSEKKESERFGDDEYQEVKFMVGGKKPEPRETESSPESSRNKLRRYGEKDE